MPSAKTLNAQNLEALGAERLAALLIEVATGDAAFKRRLRVALAGEASPADAAREVAKRLATIARSRGFVEWHKVKPLAADLDAQHRAILETIAPRDLKAALDRAASLVLERADAIDGNLYELLTPAADTLETKHPLAATILRRAMIDFTLTKARSSRYGHAARHLATCAALAGRIDDWGALPGHPAYIADLQAAHGRKTGLWNLAVS